MPTWKINATPNRSFILADLCSVYRRFSLKNNQVDNKSFDDPQRINQRTSEKNMLDSAAWIKQFD